MSIHSSSNSGMQIAKLSGTRMQEILRDIFQNYIAHEISCFRQELEDAHFVCATYMLEQLLNYTEQDLQQREVVKQDLQQFILYMIKHKQLYITLHLVDELRELERNCTNIEYLRKLGTFYRYYSLGVSQKVFEKIECIKQELSRENQLFFAHLLEKIKVSLQTKIRPSDLRYGIISGAFQQLSLQIQAKNRGSQGQADLQALQGSKYILFQSDNKLIDQRYREVQYLQDTMIGEEYLKVYAQIERVQKGIFDGQPNLEQVVANQINEIYKSKCQYVQIAEQLRVLISKHIKTKMDEKRMEEEMANQDGTSGQQRGNYWNLVEYKLTHDRLMIECLMNDCYSSEKSAKPNLLNLVVQDNANQLCRVELGKFGNILALGLNDGQILIYELTERFLLPGASSQYESSKNILTIHNSFYLQSHQGAITALSLLYDELYLLSTSVDRSIKLWCLRSRSPLIAFKGHLQQVWCMSWAPAGYLFASGSADRTAMLWATDHIHSQRVLRHTAGVYVLAFTPSVQQLITGDENRALRVWSVEKGECLHLQGLDAQPTTLGISLSGQFLAVGGQDGQIILYFLPSMKEIRQLIYLEKQNIENTCQTRKPIQHVDFSYDETTLTCCNLERTAFFSIAELLRQTNEDAFLGVYTTQQLQKLKISDNGLRASVTPILMLDNQCNKSNWMIKYIPQGSAIQIVT